MNISLILTKQCNLRCKYCFESHESCAMSEETALAAVDFVAKNSLRSCGISFFGGEPLLQKNLIYKCVEHAETLADKQFNYNMTTNGLLLDEEFLKFAAENRIRIAMSHDGLMSCANRVYADGRDCLAALDEKLSLLLKYQPKAFIMATVAVNTVDSAAKSVIYLYESGVRTLNLAVDMRPDADWNEEALNVLSGEFDKISEYLLDKFTEDKEISFNSFDEKIFNITKNKPKHLCQLGKRKVMIDVDGAIYPCIQFNGRAEYRMGNVYDGIDAAAQNKIYHQSIKKPECCNGCALESRCVNDCSCANFQQCGDMNTVSPVQCAYQRIVIEKADSLARKMLEADEGRFIKRYMK